MAEQTSMTSAQFTRRSSATGYSSLVSVSDMQEGMSKCYCTEFFLNILGFSDWLLQCLFLNTKKPKIYLLIWYLAPTGKLVLKLWLNNRVSLSPFFSFKLPTPSDSCEVKVEEYYNILNLTGLRITWRQTSRGVCEDISRPGSLRWGDIKYRGRHSIGSSHGLNREKRVC